MEIKQAIEILEHHNQWRRGHTNDMKYSVKELGQAIDEVVTFSKRSIEIRDKKTTCKDPILNKIERQIIQEFGYNFEDLRTEERNRKFAKPRQVAMYFIEKLSELSNSQIANIFNRDRTNVYQSKKIINNLIESDKDMIRIGNDIDERLL
jgi:chromosomal replication initiation ATPase DnaA